MDREVDMWAEVSRLGSHFKAIIPWKQYDAVCFLDLENDTGGHAWMGGDTFGLLIDRSKEIIGEDEIQKCLENMRSPVLNPQVSKHSINIDLSSWNISLPRVHLLLNKYIPIDGKRLRYIMDDVVAFINPNSGKTYRQKQPDGSGWKVEKFPANEHDSRGIERLVISMTEAVILPENIIILETA